MEYIELLENCIYHNPLALLSVTNQETVRKINSYIPFTVGFEIECSPLKDITEAVKEEFRSIPNITKADVNNNGEIRFQIPTGINGLMCLYHISKKLKVYYGLNLDSGIHYHIGIQDYTIVKNLILQESNYVLKELDSWNYKGNYNARSISTRKRNWVRLSSFNTVEYRIGEMTFDYDVLVKRIIHCCNITKNVIEKNTNIRVAIPNYEFDNKLHLVYLKINNKSSIYSKINMLENEIKTLLEQHNKKVVYDTELEDRLVKTRVIKI